MSELKPEQKSGQMLTIGLVGKYAVYISEMALTLQLHIQRSHPEHYIKILPLQNVGGADVISIAATKYYKGVKNGYRAYNPDTEDWVMYKIIAFPCVKGLDYSAEAFQLLALCNIVLFITRAENPMDTRDEQDFFALVNNAAGANPVPTKVALVVATHPGGALYQLSVSDIRKLAQNVPIPSGVLKFHLCISTVQMVGIYGRSSKTMRDRYSDPMSCDLHTWVADAGDYDGLFAYIFYYHQSKLEADYLAMCRLIVDYSSPWQQQTQLSDRAKKITKLVKKVTEGSYKLGLDIVGISNLIVDMLEPITGYGVLTDETMCMPPDTHVEYTPEASHYLNGRFCKIQVGTGVQHNGVTTGSVVDQPKLCGAFKFNPGWYLMRKLFNLCNFTFVQTYKWGLLWIDQVKVPLVEPRSGVKWLVDQRYFGATNAYAVVPSADMAEYIDTRFKEFCDTGGEIAWVVAHILNYDVAELRLKARTPKKLFKIPYVNSRNRPPTLNLLLRVVKYYLKNHVVCQNDTWVSTWMDYYTTRMDYYGSYPRIDPDEYAENLETYMKGGDIGKEPGKDRGAVYLSGIGYVFCKLITIKDIYKIMIPADDGTMALEKPTENSGIQARNNLKQCELDLEESCDKSGYRWVEFV